MNCKKFVILILSCIFAFAVCFTSFAQLDVHDVSIRKEGNVTIVQVSGWKEQKSRASGKKAYGHTLNFGLIASDANIHHTGTTRSDYSFGCYTNQKSDKNVRINGFDVLAASPTFANINWNNSKITGRTMKYGVNNRVWQDPFVVVPEAQCQYITPFTSMTINGYWQRKGLYNITFRFENLHPAITRFTAIDVEAWYEDHLTGWGVKGARYYCINHNGVLQHDANEVREVTLC